MGFLSASIVIVISVGLMSSVIRLLENKVKDLPVDIAPIAHSNLQPDGLFDNNATLNLKSQNQSEIKPDSSLKEISKQLHLFINNVDYVFKVSVSEREPDDVQLILYNAAVEFCSKMGGNLGFALDTITVCISPLYETLTKKYKDIHSGPVNLILSPPNSERHEIDAYGEEAPPSDRQSTELGSGMGTLAGTEEEYDVKVSLKINGVDYVFQYDRSAELSIEESSALLAQNFCQAKGEAFFESYFKDHAVETSEERARVIEESCVSPVQNSLVANFHNVLKASEEDPLP